MKHQSIVRVLAVAFPFFVPALFGQAERPPVSTDRPSVSASTWTAPKGAAQVEAGFDFAQLDLSQNQVSLRSRQYGTPFLLRFGLMDRLELRIDSYGGTWISNSLEERGQVTYDQSDKGFSNPSVGVKWRLNDQKEGSWKPALGVLVQSDLPVGSKDYRPEKAGISAGFLADFPLPQAFSLTFNAIAAVRHDSFTGEYYNRGLGALALGRALSRKTSFYIEVAGGGPQGDGGEGFVLIDGGLAYSVAPGLVIDCAISRGLTEFSPDWGVGVGASFYLF